MDPGARGRDGGRACRKPPRSVHAAHPRAFASWFLPEAPWGPSVAGRGHPARRRAASERRAAKSRRPPNPRWGRFSAPSISAIRASTSAIAPGMTSKSSTVISRGSPSRLRRSGGVAPRAVDDGDGLLPVPDQVASERRVPESLDRHGPPTAQAGPRAPDDLGRVDGGQRAQVRAADQRDVAVVDAAGEQGVTTNEHLRPTRFSHGAPLPGQGVVQGQGLSRLDLLHFPHREPRGALCVEPACL